MIVMEDFYLSQALFRTQEILDNFTNERSMQVRLKALTENGRIEKIKNGLYAAHSHRRRSGRKGHWQGGNRRHSGQRAGGFRQ